MSKAGSGGMERKTGHLVILFLGLAVVGLLIGYMVGASSTPVVGAAIPVVFGLVATGFALLQRTGNSDAVTKAIEKISTAGDLAKILKQADEQAKRSFSEAARDVGIALIVFSVFYFLGTLVGAQLRLNGTFAQFYPENFKSLIWEVENSNLEAPPNLAEAIAWLSLQRSLDAYGFDDTEIATLYELAYEQWNPEKEEPSAFPWDDDKQPYFASAAYDWILLQKELLDSGYKEEDVKALYLIQWEEWQKQKDSESNVPTYRPIRPSALSDVVGAGVAASTPVIPTNAGGVEGTPGVLLSIAEIEERLGQLFPEQGPSILENLNDLRNEFDLFQPELSIPQNELNTLIETYIQSEIINENSVLRDIIQNEINSGIENRGDLLIPRNDLPQNWRDLPQIVPQQGIPGQQNLN